MRTSVYSTLTLSNITTSEPHLSAPLPTTHQPSPTLQPQFPFLVFFSPPLNPAYRNQQKQPTRQNQPCVSPTSPRTPTSPPPKTKPSSSASKSAEAGNYLLWIEHCCMLHLWQMAGAFHPLRHPIPSHPISCHAHPMSSSSSLSFIPPANRALETDNAAKKECLPLRHPHKNHPPGLHPRTLHPPNRPLELGPLRILSPPPPPRGHRCPLPGRNRILVFKTRQRRSLQNGRYEGLTGRTTCGCFGLYGCDDFGL